MELRLFSGGSMLGGSVAFDSSRIVCSTVVKLSCPYGSAVVGHSRLFMGEDSNECLNSCFTRE